MATLICSIHRGNICYSEIYRRDADKTIVLYCNDKSHPKYVSELKKTLKEIPARLSQFNYSIRPYETPGVFEIGKEIVSIIKENPSESEFYLHWSEGPRAGIVSCILVASIMKDKVKGAFISHGDLKKPKNSKLPIFDLKLNEEKLAVLKSIGKGEKRGYKIAGKDSSLKKSRVYSLIKKLRDDGFIDSSDGLTDFGRVAVEGCGDITGKKNTLLLALIA